MKRHKHRPRPPQKGTNRRARERCWHIGPTSQAQARVAPPTPHVTIDLAFPIEINGLQLSSLTMRYPTPKDLAWFRFLRGGENARAMAIAARLCDLPREALDQLDEADADDLFAAGLALVCGD